MAVPHNGHSPNLENFIKSLKGQSLEASIESLLMLLRRRQVQGSEQCAIATAHILRQVVAKSRFADVDSLIDRVQHVGRKLVEASPQELVISNIVRRVLGLIRDEAEEDRNGDGTMDDSMSEMSALTGDDQHHPSPAPRPLLRTASSFHIPQSMFNLLSGDPTVDTSATGSPFGRGSGSSTPMTLAQPANINSLRLEVLDGIEEIQEEIHAADDQIANFAEIQIHPGDFVLAHQPNHTVERSLVGAAKRRQFTVLLAGSAPPGKPSEDPYAVLRKKLGHFGVKTINVSGSGMMAYMPKVAKVIIGARAVASNGAVIADGGAGLVARAAHEYHKTVIVLGAVFKLCPEDEPDLGPPLHLGDPGSLVEYSDGGMVADSIAVECITAEVIRPELVDIYITNLGPHSRDHLQGVVADHYKKEDMDFLVQ